MSDLKNTKKEDQFWTLRYEEERTGWDIGYPSTPLEVYFDQLNNKELNILIPGAGNAYEAEYLFHQGFKNIYVMDISITPLLAFQKRVPDFPADHLIHENFFEHVGQYELIIEQTFFCSFPPSTHNRSLYAEKMASLLMPGGKLVGLWFKHPLIPGNMEKRPFGGSLEEYLGYLAPYFEVLVFEDCRNSIKPRMGNELFSILRKRK